MTVKEDAWLASVMGRPVFRVDAGDAGSAAAVREHVQSGGGGGETSSAGARFYFAKVDAADVAKANALVDVGFFVADVNVTFAAAPSAITAGPPPSVDVGTLPPAKKEQVLAIAHDTFRFTRFHLDPLVDKAIADKVKKEWVRNYADGKRGDHLFVAIGKEGTLAGEPVGFLAALKSHDGSQAIIDLVGVHPGAQRRGVGRAMITRFAEHYRGAKELLVGTQVANVASVTLYESMGFRLKSSQLVLHMHVREGKAVRA